MLKISKFLNYAQILHALNLIDTSSNNVALGLKNENIQFYKKYQFQSNHQIKYGWAELIFKRCPFGRPLS